MMLRRIMVDSEIQLGDKVESRISGFTGIVTTVGEHITGCERIGVRSSEKRKSQQFFFEDHLEVVDDDTEFSDAGQESYVEHEFELGERVTDRLTKFNGVITVINYRLCNAPSVCITSDRNAPDEEPESHWVDVHRLRSDISGSGFVDEFEDGVEDSDVEASTGSVSDCGPRNYSE